MRTRWLVPALALLALAAAPAAAEEATADRAQENPAGLAVGETTRLVDQAGEGPIVRVFHESWEEAPSIEEAGWTVRPVDGADAGLFRRVHRRQDDPNPGPRPTPIATESPPHAVTVMNADGTYPAGADTRLVSPTIDLRYVLGASADTTKAHRDDDVGPLLRELQRAYQEATAPGSRFTSPYGYLLATPPSSWFPVPCAPEEVEHCQRLERGTYQLSSGTRGREAYDDQSRRVSSNDVGPGSITIFGFTVLDPQPVSGSVPVPGTRDQGLYAAEGGVYAPNPLDHREGTPYVNLTFWHKWNLWDHPGGRDAAFLEVRHRQADGTWSPWRHLEPAEVWNQPGVNTSTLAHEQTSGERTTPYNGWKGDRRAFVDTSNGLVASTFNLNRFAGTRIQLAWRFQSEIASRPETGWFVDDVAIWSDTYPWDVGVRSVEHPGKGDRVAPSLPFHPSATVRNYGHHATHDVRVTFRVTPADANTTLWSDTRTLDRLDPQEQLEVRSSEAFDPQADLQGHPTGSYRLVANVTPYAAPDDPAEENLTRRPQTTTNRENDRRSVPFQVQAKPRAEVAVDVPEGSVQTDVEVPKTFTVTVENTGNLPLSGRLEVTATRLNATTLEPVAEAQVVDTVEVRPGALPFGTDLNVFGSEDNTWTRRFRWEEGLETPGTYRIRATLSTDHGRFDGSAPAYVRATPAPYYREDAEDLLANPFDDASVYSLGMDVQAWRGDLSEGGDTIVEASPVLPEPVSPSHVWFGRGDDGGLGTAQRGRQAEGIAGADAADAGTYGAAEPDARPATRDPNLVDHYWLTREVDLTAYEAGDTRLVLTFWHTGEFNWSGRPTTDQREATRSRGHVEILPQDNAYLTDPGPGLDAAPGTPGTATGVEPVDDRTPARTGNVTLVAGDALYAQSLATYESPVPWTREHLDLTPWAGEKVTLRFHLETTARRPRVNASAGALNPWLVDNVLLRARDDGTASTVFRTDVEGDDWRRWSTADGVRARDPRSPVAVATSPGDQVVGPSTEGRGWDRYAYPSNRSGSGWFRTTLRQRPVAGIPKPDPMLRWGHSPATDRLPTGVNVSVLRTPTFTLEGTRDPALSFLQRHDLPSEPRAFPNPDDVTYSEEDPHVTTGASVWIVGTDDEGNVVKRHLLTPAPGSEARYDGYIRNWNVEEGNPTECTYSEVQCQTPLYHYPNRTTLQQNARYGDPAGNVFSGRSGVDDGTRPPEWERAVFDLSRYATPENRSLTYHLEFHGINQRTDSVEGVGWLVDGIQITERTFANDVAVADVVRPSEDTLGPGLRVPVALQVRNRGIYDQVGVEATYRVLDAEGNVVHGPVTTHTKRGLVIPGARTTADPDKNATAVFETGWTTPTEEGRYTIEGRVDLSDALPGHAYPDDNPVNDVLRETVHVTSERSVGLVPADEHPDRDVVDPFLGSTDAFRTFTVRVENKGTLPEVFTGTDAGAFAVNLTIRDSSGAVVATSEAPIRSLAPGAVREVTFRRVWQPNTTGVYEIDFTLEHPNETVRKSARDDVRTLTYTVFDEMLPRPREDLRSMFRAEGAGWRFAGDAWTFGRGEAYRPDANDSLVLARSLDLRNLRRGAIRLNHSYGFETGYDGALLEVKPDDGHRWHPVPPQPADEGYPRNMSSASPLVESPDGSAAAFSGTSGDRSDPTPTETVFELGAVDALVTRSSIFEDPLASGFGETPSSRRGTWSQEYLSRVTPRTGDRMVHSSHAGVPCRLVEGDCNPPSHRHDARKHLNLTFDDDFPEGQPPLARRLQDEDVQALRVVFWDYRAIAPGDPEEAEAETPNEVSAQVTCAGSRCPEDASVTLDRVRASGYDDNYRGWTRNVYTVPTAELQDLLDHGRGLNLTLTHHVFARGPAWATDEASLHAGWFVDDVAVQTVAPTGKVATYWNTSFEGARPATDDGVRRSLGPWSGGAWVLHDDGGTDHTEALLWHLSSGWGGEALCTRSGDPETVRCSSLTADERRNASKRHGLWRHVEAGELPCGPLVDGPQELDPSNRSAEDYPRNYTASADHFRACGPTRGHRDRAGGGRLVTTLDLRPAVDDVTLAFDHRFRFRHATRFGDPSTVGYSAGRVEVSVDGGDTWIPLEPEAPPGQTEHFPMKGFDDDSPRGVHSTLGGLEGDPESNSIYGKGGAGFTGLSGSEPEDPRTVTARYDLSRFAGRQVKLAWHASFGTHNTSRYPSGTEAMGYEFWAVENVSVDADVLEGDVLDLRLRAASDRSNGDAGWTVHDLQMIGTRSDVNVGVEVAGLEETLPSGQTAFALSLENRGETPVPVHVNVTVDGPDDGFAFAAETVDPIRLPATGDEARTRLEAVAGRPLETLLEAGATYDVTARVTIADGDLRAREVVTGDNRDRFTVDDVRSGSRLTADDLRITPNSVPAAADAGVAVAVAVTNDGFDRSKLDYANLTLALNRTSAPRPSLVLTGADPLADDAGPNFRRPFQTKTYTWRLSPEQVADLPGGLYNVTVAVQSQGRHAASTIDEPLYLGTMFLQDHAYRQRVRNATLAQHDTCRFSLDASAPRGAPSSWASTGDEAETNRSPYRSFTRTDGGAGFLLCSFPNLGTLREDLHARFYTRHRFPLPDTYNVTVRRRGPDGQCSPTDALVTRQNVLEDLPSTTPGFNQGKFVPYSFPVPGSGTEGVGCIGFNVRGTQDANVDDVLVAPYHVELTPDRTEVPIQSNTEKRFPFTVTNHGAFNDTFRFAFVDQLGDRSKALSRWDLQVVDAEGTPRDRVQLAAGETRTLYLSVSIPVQGVGRTAGATDAHLTAVSTTTGLVRDTAAFDFRFTYPSRPDLTVVEASVSGRDLPVGQPRSVSVTLANVGVDPVEDVPVTVTDTMPARFGEPPKELARIDGGPLPNVTLDPGDTTTLIAGWTPDRPGPHNLTVRVDPAGDVVEPDRSNNVEVLEVPVGAARFPDLAVDLETNTTEAQVGDGVAVNATITNEGTAPAIGVRTTFRVGVSDLLSGEAPHILPEPIAPGETVTLQARWPASFPGEYTAFAKAFPLSGHLEPTSAQSDNLASRTLTVRSASLRLQAPDALQARQGQDVTAQVPLENRGDRNETVDLTARAGSGLRARVLRNGVTASAVEVPAHATRNLTLAVRVPTEIAADTYPVTLTAVSQETGQTESATVPLRVARETGLALEATGAEVEPGGGPLPLQVTNTGNAPATVNVTSAGLPAGWSLQADPTRVAPFATERVQARLVVPTDAEAGVRDLRVGVRSASSSASAPLRVTVGSRAVLDVTLDPGQVAVQPGTRLRFQAQLASVGNVPAEPDLHLQAPDGWSADLPRPRAQVPDGGNLTFPVTVRVPEGASPGDHVLTLAARGEEETFAGNATVHVGVPDLVVTDVQQTPRVNVEAGADVSFRASVRNVGSLDLESVGLGLYVDDPRHGYQDVGPLPSGARTQATLNWTAEAGENVVLLVADPGERVVEGDEGNNARLVVVQVGGAQVFGDVEQATPGPGPLALLALLGAAVARRWRT